MPLEAAPTPVYGLLMSRLNVYHAVAHGTLWCPMLLCFWLDNRESDAERWEGEGGAVSAETVAKLKFFICNYLQISPGYVYIYIYTYILYPTPVLF